MGQTPKTPFDGIESAHEFLALLVECVADAKNELEAHIARESSNPSRRLDAFRVASYKVERLQDHVNRSVRLLNDLRSLRRLVFEEREAAKAKLVEIGEVAKEPAAISHQDGTDAREKELVAA